MIGDIRAFFKTLIRRHITCKHDYKFVPDKVFYRHDSFECRICGRIKKA